MALYVLSYDLRNQRNYQPLYDQLDSFQAVRVLESVWAFNRINTTAGDLRDFFNRFIDNDDGLFVMEVSDWGTMNARKTPNDLP